tara:strand:+ start:81 stop:572 length:492 start_codon:yes stop_codon:yes gene_type:complete
MSFNKEWQLELEKLTMHDYKWIGRFKGDWLKELNKVKLTNNFKVQGIWKIMLDKLGMEHTEQVFHTQYSDTFLELSIDRFYKEKYESSKIGRFFIFVEDWKPGDFLYYKRWRKGDIVQFDNPKIPHNSTNKGNSSLCLLQCSGLITQVTEDLILGKNGNIIKI